MNIETIKSVYFVGAGGIGMSALVRYFLFKGKGKYARRIHSRRSAGTRRTGLFP